MNFDRGKSQMKKKKFSRLWQKTLSVNDVVLILIDCVCSGVFVLTRMNKSAAAELTDRFEVNVVRVFCFSVTVQWIQKNHNNTKCF